MNTQTKVPVHFWAVSIVSLLWNAFGGYDYAMSRSRNLDYINSATGGQADAMLKWMDSLPLLAQVGWPIGVWGSVLGSLLLLARSRHAATAFLVSLIGAAVSFGVEYADGIPPELDSSATKVMTVVIFAAIVVFWWYARRAAAKGWLR